MPSETRVAAGAKAPGVERIGPRSLRRQTREALLNAIRGGVFPDGKLPAENDLAAALGVSRTTLRAALQTLEDDGVLSRRRGIGTRVVEQDEGPFQLELNRLAALDDLLRDRGHESSTEIVSVGTSVLPDVAGRIGYPPETEWHVIEKIWYADDLPAALLRDHIPCSVVEHLPDSADAIETIFRLFEEFGPEPIARARVELVPHAAEQDVAERLQILVGEAYLRLWQRHYGRSEQPLAISRLDVNDHFIRFEIVRRV
jgi:GntR family transcriptional regulator